MPSLFNINFSAMVAYWRAKYPKVGVTVKYRHGRRLVGDQTAKSPLDQIRITESQFAASSAVYATSRDAFKSADAASKWGLTVSVHKIKGTVIGSHTAPTDTLPVQIEGGLIEIVQDLPQKQHHKGW